MNIGKVRFEPKP